MCYCRFDCLEDAVAGRLAYDGRGGLILRVMEPPRPTTEATGRVISRLERKRHIRVDCELETGEFAVLRDLRPQDYDPTYKITSTRTESYRVPYALVGARVLGTKFDTITSEFAGLSAWMNQNPFTIVPDSVGAIAIEHMQPKMTKIKVADGMALEIGYLYRIPLSFMPGDEEYKISQSAAVVIHSKPPLSIDALHDRMIRFSHLVALATGAHIQTKSIILFDGQNEAGLFGKYGVQRTETINAYEFRFFYTDIREHFEKMVASWFEFYEDHHDGLSLYFSNLTRDHPLDLKEDFLRIFQSLEALHKVDHSEQGLRSMISSFLDRHDGVLGSTDKQEFAKLVVDIRNRFAHGDVWEHDDVWEHEDEMRFVPDLIKTTRRLDLLMIVHLIDSLHIPEPIKEAATSKVMQRVSALEALEEKNRT